MKALKVGIVGAAGQVGSALLEGFNRDAELMAVGICRSNVSAARIASRGMQVIITQTNDAARLTEATRDLDVLINCALPQYAPSKTSAVNRQLAKSLTSACEGKTLVHLSSVAVYGDYIPGKQEFFKHPMPSDGYGRQKLQMEQLLRQLSTKTNTKCAILRVGHVYGPQLRWSEAFFQFIRNDSFRLPFDGQIPSNGVLIENLVAGIRRIVLDAPASGTYNLVDSPQTTWREIFDLHARACGRPEVKPLNTMDSELLASRGEKRCRAGLVTRITGETWSWMKKLPSSYLASVPTFKEVAQRIVAAIGSETLDSKLWAMYCRLFSHVGTEENGPSIPAIMFSDQVPGPCLSYVARSPVEDLEALRHWYDSISLPSHSPNADLVFERER